MSDAASLQQTAVSRSSSLMSAKEQRKRARRIAKRDARIAAAPGLAEATKLVFQRYDADENGHVDIEEIFAMILDLQRQVADHKKITESSARETAKLLAKALDRDGNNEIELAELQDWIIRKSEKLDDASRRRIMAMHDGGGTSEAVERQVVLVRVITAVESVCDFSARGNVVAVFGRGKLGVKLSDAGDIVDVVSENDRQGIPQLARMHASGAIAPGMVVLRVGPTDLATSDWTATGVSVKQGIEKILAEAPRPIQVVFGEAPTEKVEAARKLQAMRKQQRQMRAARRDVDRKRLRAVSNKTFKRYDIDGNGTLDIIEVEKMLLDIIVSWSGVGEDSEGTNDEHDVTDFDISKEMKLAYLGARLIEKKYGTQTSERGKRTSITRATFQNGPLGMRIANVEVPHDDINSLANRREKLDQWTARKRKRLESRPEQLIVCTIQDPGKSNSIGIKFDLNQKVVFIKTKSQADAVPNLIRGDRLLSIGGTSVATMVPHEISSVIRERKWPGGAWPVEFVFQRTLRWNVNPDTGLPAELDEEMLKMLLLSYDTDGTGSLNAVQFMGFIREVHSIAVEFRGREMGVLDDLAEEQYGNIADGHLLEHCQRMVKERDKSGDGRLDVHELIDWFRKGIGMNSKQRADFREKSGPLTLTLFDDVAYGLHMERSPKDLEEQEKREENEDVEDAVAVGLTPMESASRPGPRIEFHVTEVVKGSQADAQRVKVGDVLQKVAGTSTAGFSHEDLLNLLRETPRPLEMVLVRGKSGEPVMDLEQFGEFVIELAEMTQEEVESHKWETEEEMRVELFLVEVARAISSNADMLRGGRNVVIMFYDDGSLGIRLTSDGRVASIVNGGQADAYNAKEGAKGGGLLEPGMVLTKVGKRTFDGIPSTSSFSDVLEEFEDLEARAPRPLRCVFRKPTYEETQAAKTVQRYTRGRSTRKVLAEKERHVAATKVQTHVRRRKASVIAEKKKADSAMRMVMHELTEHAQTCSGPLAKKYMDSLDLRLQRLKSILMAWDTGNFSVAELLQGIKKVTPSWGAKGSPESREIQDLRQRINMVLLRDPRFWEAEMAIRVVQDWIRAILMQMKWKRVVEDAAARKIQGALERGKNRKEGRAELERRRKDRGEVNPRSETSLGKDTQQGGYNQTAEAAGSGGKTAVSSEKSGHAALQKTHLGASSSSTPEEILPSIHSGGGSLSQHPSENSTQSASRQFGESEPQYQSQSHTQPTPQFQPQFQPQPQPQSQPQLLNFPALQGLASNLSPPAQNAVAGLINSKLFLQVNPEDLMPLMRAAPAHQVAIVRQVMGRARSGDPSELRKMVEEATAVATGMQEAKPQTDGSFQSWGPGDTYQMRDLNQMQISANIGNVPAFGNYSVSNDGFRAAHPVRFMPMPMMMPFPHQYLQPQQLVHPQQNSSGYYAQQPPQYPPKQGSNYDESPRLKRLRPGRSLLENGDPKNFSGVVVFEKGKPVEAHVDEPGQKPVWDELWSEYNRRHGVD